MTLKKIYIKYFKKHLTTAIENGDRSREGGAYGRLGNSYQSQGDYRKAIEYHQKHLKIAKEIGDRGGEGGDYGNLGNAYQSLGDYRKAIEYHEKHLKIAIEIGDQGLSYHATFSPQSELRGTLTYRGEVDEI